MLEKSVLIAALARDCNKSVLRNIPKIEKLRKEFKESHVVIIENDSKDGTKETLKRWEKESIGVEAIMNDYGTITIPEQSKGIKNPGTSMHRISKMAKYRNIYMDYARNADFNIDYLIVIDIDIEDFSVEGIIDSINNAPNDWGGLFANGIKYYNKFLFVFYDTFAFIPYKSKYIDLTINENITHAHKMTNKVKYNSYIKCLSAFGGIGIYKWDIISDLYYKADKNNRSKVNETICEHIPFNIEIINKGYMNYISSRMKVIYGKPTFKESIFFTFLPSSLILLIYKIMGRELD